MRFHRSIKILPGIRLNLSKSGMGISAGPRGLKVGVDAKGRKYVSAAIPGTGISSRQYLAPAEKAPRLPASSSPVEAAMPRSSSRRPFWVAAAAALVAVGLAVVLTQRSAPELAPLRELAILPAAPIAPTPAETAAAIARAALLRQHPTYLSESLAEGDVSARDPSGFDVTLKYRTKAGADLPYICKVVDAVATCAARSGAGLTTPAADAGEHVGPRGGVYHYSANGKKVYKRRHR